MKKDNESPKNSKTENFTISERLSLDRLKHKPCAKRSELVMRRETAKKSTEDVTDSKDWIANLLETEKDSGAEFEREMVKRGARRFAEWIEKELKK